MPLLNDLESVRDAPANPDNFLAKMQIKSVLPAVEAALYPEDDDG